MFKLTDKQTPSVHFEDEAMQAAYEHGLKQGVARADIKHAALDLVGAVCALFVSGLAVYKIHKINQELNELSHEAQFKKLLEENLED